MKKSDKTKELIEKFVPFFKKHFNDIPTQREVAHHLRMSVRTVQRYYKTIMDLRFTGKHHQYNQIGHIRLIWYMDIFWDEVNGFAYKDPFQ